MYQEKEQFNWLSLFIKVVIFVVFILLAIWLVTKVINKFSDDEFEENMNVLKSASVEYFKKGNLPDKEGESKEITLGDLIKMKYITSFDKTCDREKSYSQATLVDDYYALRVELVCGDKQDYIYTSIEVSDVCIDEDCISNNEDNIEEAKEEDTNTEIEDNPSTGDTTVNKNTTSNNNSTSKKTLYYEHVKVDKVYSNWQTSKITGNNVERKTDNVKLNTYCQIINNDYYIVGYRTKENVKANQSYVFTVKLNDVDVTGLNKKIVVKEFFDNNNSMYNTYLSTTPKVSFIDGNSAYNTVNSASSLMNSSLKSNNITYKRAITTISDNSVYLHFSITVNNLNNVSTYNNKYYFPMHIGYQYLDKNSCIEDTSYNASKYNEYEVTSSRNSTITLYRSYSMQKKYNDIKWSVNKSLDGYELTGKTEYR